MANGKETKRERRDAARKARLEAQRRAKARARKRKLYVALSLVLIGGLIGFLVWNAGRSERAASERVASLASAAGCDAPQSHASEGRDHIEATEAPTYDTEPPSSGGHFDSTANTGVYSSPAPDGNLVHNLEHGHVIIWYDPAALDGEIIDEVEAFVRENETRAISMPRPTLAEEEVPLAYSSWTRTMTCADPTTPEDVRAVSEAFFEAFAQQAPEDFPGTPNR